MTSRLSPATALLLTVPPLLWAGNAVVGRMLNNLVPPATLNLLRWSIAMLILLPLAGWIFRRGSSLWTHWRRFMVLGLLGVGVYNALQYLALESSSPINVTLVAASMPVWMILIGRMFFGAPISGRQVAGVALSIAGVLVVMAHGEWAHLRQLKLVPGDVLMLAAAIAWSLYSWLLTRPGDPQDLRADWAAFLLAQIAYGVVWSALFAAGEWALKSPAMTWSWPVAAALLFVAAGPGIIAFRCWGSGVQRAGPTIAAFFSNLTPLFTAVMSSAFLGEPPRLYHAAGFVLIVGGIVVSSRR